MAKKLIQFDWAMKHILRQKENFEILEGFLSELLHEDIFIDSILESEGNQDVVTDKYNRVDILTKNSQGEIILVEIQNNYEYDYFQRMLYGTSKVITEYLKTGESYAKLKKVVSVNIVYFDLGEGDDYLYYGGVEFKGMTQNDVLEPNFKQKQVFHIDKVSEIFPQYYIIKLCKFDNDIHKRKNNKGDKDKVNQILTDTLDQWVYFLKNSEAPEICDAKGLAQAQKTLDKLHLSEKDRYSYEYYMDALRVQQSEMESKIIREEEFEEMKGELHETKEQLKNSQKIAIEALLEFRVPISKILELYPHFSESEILTFKK
jgi:hypothetical protein